MINRIDQKTGIAAHVSQIGNKTSDVKNEVVVQPVPNEPSDISEVHSTGNRDNISPVDSKMIGKVGSEAGSAKKEMTVEELVREMTVEDEPLDDTGRKNLLKYMSLYPKEILRYISDTGFKIRIVADPPQPPGATRPSDLGFGDHNGDGVVNPEHWVDFNQNGKADPWEYEGKVGIPDASGKMHTLSLDEYVDGAYMPSKNIIYLFKSLLGDDRPNAGLYTVTHEFAHAVDFNLRKDPVMGEKFHTMVNNLYSACYYKMPEHSFFDGYQATNRAEFFAVSMQSFMSPEKLKDETGKFYIGNCYRDNLKNNDIHTFRFVDTFLKNPLQPDKWYDFTK